MRFTPAVVKNDAVEAKVYGTNASVIRAAEHEGRINLWTGLATSPVAVTLRDKRNYVDLTGLARLRWMVRTSSIHTLYPVVKLADGSLHRRQPRHLTDGEFLQVEVVFAGMRWYKLGSGKGGRHLRGEKSGLQQGRRGRPRDARSRRRPRRGRLGEPLHGGTVRENGTSVASRRSAVDSQQSVVSSRQSAAVVMRAAVPSSNVFRLACHARKHPNSFSGSPPVFFATADCRLVTAD